ncbi:MAG TPA: DUF5399 family protein [Chlamydiales bacterium]|nr:DUF5399 family protein [Chlamydiales bacterium]
MTPKTIDNLGPEAYNRYAKDQTFLDERLIKEAQYIPQKAERSVTTPYTPSEFDQMFSISKSVSWAHFAPPPNYAGYGNALFSYQLVPSLGNYEKLESNSDMIESLEAILHNTDQERDEKKRDQEQESDEKEREILASFFQCLGKLNKALTMINALRNRYHKG